MGHQIIYNKKTVNFIISNHLGGITTNNSRRIELALHNINSYIAGRK